MMTSDSYYRLISCLDLINTKWAVNESIVSSEGIIDQQNNQWIGSGITFVFDEDGCTVTECEDVMFCGTNIFNVLLREYSKNYLNVLRYFLLKLSIIVGCF